MHYNEVIAAEMRSLLEELHLCVKWIEREDYGDLTATTRRMHDHLIQLSGIANLIRATAPDNHSATASAPLSSTQGVSTVSGVGPGRRVPAPEVLAEQPDEAEEVEGHPDGRDVYMKVRRMGSGSR